MKTLTITVFKEMEKVIKSMLSKSFADLSYNKVIDALRAYRSEAIEVVFFQFLLTFTKLDEPRHFNDYLKSLKEELLAGNLGGNRRDFWELLRKKRVGLIRFDESELDQTEGIDEAVFNTASRITFLY